MTEIVLGLGLVESGDFVHSFFSAPNLSGLLGDLRCCWAFHQTEYAQTGKLTNRSDVFSFGVMLLELITGRRPIDKDEGQFSKEDNIVNWARPLLAQAMDDANYDTLADARLSKDYDSTPEWLPASLLMLHHFLGFRQLKPL